jgi:hypothetical protein
MHRVMSAAAIAGVGAAIFGVTTARGERVDRAGDAGRESLGAKAEGMIAS